MRYKKKATEDVMYATAFNLAATVKIFAEKQDLNNLKSFKIKSGFQRLVLHWTSCMSHFFWLVFLSFTKKSTALFC